MAAPRHLADLAGTRRNQFRINPAGTTGAPSSGYHQIGEEHVDSAGARFYCTASGTPGTWVGAGATVITGGPLTISVATAIDSVAVATYASVDWYLVLVNGTDRYSSHVNATHNGSTATGVETMVVLGPGLITMPFTIDVDVDSGNLRLLVIPSASGWSYRLTRTPLPV